MREHRLEIVLTVQAPFLTQATAAGLPGLDAAAARRDGKAILPGTLVKGKLLDAWKRLRIAGDAAPASAADADRWLGRASPEGGDDRPERGLLYFGDFETEAPEDAAVRYRVAIDRDRGGVEHGALAAIETPFAPGRLVPFRGEVRFVAGDDEAARIRGAVAAGLRFVESIGAYRSLGFGRLCGVEVEAHGSPLPAPVPAAGETDLPGLEIVVDEPLLLARLQPQQNLFVGEPVIPGGALKGALAATWREWMGRPPSGEVTADLDPERRELGVYFARIRFRHAFLGAGGRRPVAVPLSLASVRDGGESRLYDVALLPGPSLVHGNAPAFSVDWKRRTWRTAAALCGWASPGYETRVRTAIDAGLGKSAEGQLFAYRALRPAEGQAFYAGVDLSAVPDADRAAVAAQLRSLLAGGLRHLGKTEARAALRFRDVGAAVASRPAAECGGEPVVVTLQTPAVLLDPLALDESSGREALWREYARAFERLSGGSVELLRFFARQRLAGGGYLWARFQSGTPYHPWLLTEPGSVFVFRRTAAAEATAAGWARHGLGFPAWAAEHYAGPDRSGEPAEGDDWRRCPFVAANGYGEVAVDLALHRDLLPGDVEPLSPLAPLSRPPFTSARERGERADAGRLQGAGGGAPEGAT